MRVIATTTAAGWDNYSAAYEGLNYVIDDTTGLTTAAGMVRNVDSRPVNGVNGSVTAGVSQAIGYASNAADSGQTQPADLLRATGSGVAKIGTQVVPVLVFVDGDGTIYVQSPVTGAVTWLSFNLTYLAHSR